MSLGTTRLRCRRPRRRRRFRGTSTRRRQASGLWDSASFPPSPSFAQLTAYADEFRNPTTRPPAPATPLNPAPHPSPTRPDPPLPPSVTLSPRAPTHTVKHEPIRSTSRTRRRETESGGETRWGGGVGGAVGLGGGVRGVVGLRVAGTGARTVRGEGQVGARGGMRGG